MNVEAVLIFLPIICKDYTAYGKESLIELGLWEYTETLSKADSKYWEDMNKNEVKAATKFCFFEESWNEKDLGTW